MFQNVSYYVDDEQKNKSSKLSESSNEETCIKEEKTYDISLYVPVTPAITRFCNIIDVTYTLKVIDNSIFNISNSVINLRKLH